MKKLYTLILSIIFGAAANAQDFAYSSQTLDTELITDIYSEANINIWTPDYSGITFRWNVVENTIPAEWTYSVCDYNSCYVGIPGGGTMTPITASEMSSGTTGFIKFTISPHDVPGIGTVKIHVYNQSNSAVGDTITFNFNHLAYAATGPEEDLSLSLYPNPVTETVFLSNDSDDHLKYTLTSLTGQLVSSGQVAARTRTSVDLTGVRPGIYLVTIRKEDGGIAIRKITVQ